MAIKEFLAKELASKNERKASLTARVDAIKKRTVELGEINERACDEKELKAAGEELDKLKAELVEKQAELAGLEAEIKELEDMIANADKPAEDNPANEGQPQRKQFLNFEKRGANNMTFEEREKMAKEFAERGTFKKGVAETRAILVSSGDVATPTPVASDIRPNFEHVPSIVDEVDVLDLEGMGSYEIPYEISTSEADITAEGDDYNESDPQYGYVTLTAQTVTVYSEISKQVKKQTPVNYQTKVEDSAYKALKKKAAYVITNAIATSDLSKTINIEVVNGAGAITDQTLRNIALNYGSADAVMGDAVLQLTQADLIAFGDVRSDTTLQAVYDIKPSATNPNTGTISDGGLTVRYILNSNLTPISGTAQPAVGQPAKVGMIYGQPRCCALGLFSGYEVLVSEDYLFKKGMLAIRGDAEMDAKVQVLNGFNVVTLPAATE